MKNIALTIVAAFFLSVNTSGQENHFFTPVKNFTTLVVLDNDTTSAFSRTLKYVVTKHWTITKYQFITEKESETTYKESLNHTFLGMIKNGEPYKAFGSNGGDWYSMNLVFYRYNKNGRSVDYQALGQPPSGYYASSEDLNFRGKTKGSAAFMTDTNSIALVLRYIQNSGQNTACNFFYKKGYGPVNNKIMHGKTLLICQENLDPEIKDLSELKAIYPYPVKIVSKEELFSYFSKKDPTVVLAVSGAQKKKSDYVTLMILDGESMLYLVDLFDTKTFFSKKDFKNFTKE